MAKKNLHRIEQAEERLKAADEHLDRMLLAAFPKGTYIGAILKHGQVVPTPGKIVGISAETGHVLVRIDTAKEGSKRPVRSVYYKNLHELDPLRGL